MRAYTVSIVATAIGVDRRWVDNVLSLHQIDGVQRQRQGVSRAVAPTAVLTIAIALELTKVLGAPMAVALELANSVIATGEHSPAPGVNLRIDVAAIERRLAARLADAVETHPPKRRGRPPRARRT